MYIKVFCHTHIIKDGNIINRSFLSMSHSLMVPPSIRNRLNYRAMAALVAIQHGSHILTRNSMSFCAMRPVRAVNTVLVWYLFIQGNQKNGFVIEIQFIKVGKSQSCTQKHNLIPLHDVSFVMVFMVFTKAIAKIEL
jgi:hypothetical protein